MRCDTSRSGYAAILISLWGAAVALWVSMGHPAYSEKKGDVLSLGGAVTEIVYALGEQDRLVARDSTSLYPPDAEKLPDVGYIRALSPEGVLSVAPDLIIAEDDAGPPEAVAVLKEASIPIVDVPDAYNASGIATKIRIVGEALDVTDKAETLAQTVESRITAAAERANDLPEDTRRRVMFILSTQGGRIMASGTGTAADAIISLSGGVNAMAEFEGYKPVSDEAVSRAAPDVILMMDRGGDHSITDDALFSMPALIPTPAAENTAIIRMNGLYLLGFGPRTADAIEDLNVQLYTR